MLAAGLGDSSEFNQYIQELDENGLAVVNQMQGILGEEEYDGEGEDNNAIYNAELLEGGLLKKDLEKQGDELVKALVRTHSSSLP